MVLGVTGIKDLVDDLVRLLSFRKDKTLFIHREIAVQKLQYKVGKVQIQRVQIQKYKQYVQCQIGNGSGNGMAHKYTVNVNRLAVG